MEPDQQMRNLRDFLLVYNRMTEVCFGRCTSNFNYRNLTMDEERCVDNCAGKLIRSNHRLMGTYVQLMPKMMQRRMEELESKAAENAKAEAAQVEAAQVAEAAAESGAAAQTSITAFPPQEESPVLPPTLPPSFAPALAPAVPDLPADLMPAVPAAPASLSGVGEAVAMPEVLPPTALDVPVNLDAVAPTAFTEIKVSAAAPFTPATQTLNEAFSGPSHIEDLPQSTKPSVQIESGSSVAESVQSAFAPPKLASFSDVVPVSTVAPLNASESLRGPEKAPEVSPPSGQD